MEIKNEFASNSVKDHRHNKMLVRKSKHRYWRKVRFFTSTPKILYLVLFPYLKYPHGQRDITEGSRFQVEIQKKNILRMK